MLGSCFLKSWFHFRLYSIDSLLGKVMKFSHSFFYLCASVFYENLQCVILAWRIPMDRGAWQATVHRVTKSWTRLNDFTFFSIVCTFCSIIYTNVLWRKAPNLWWEKKQMGKLVGIRKDMCSIYIKKNLVIYIYANNKMTEVMNNFYFILYDSFFFLYFLKCMYTAE